MLTLPRRKFLQLSGAAALVGFSSDSAANSDYSHIKGVPPVQFLDEHLLNEGSHDMTIDGSSTPVDFSYTVPSTHRYAIVSRFLFYIEDSTAFSSTEFGGLGAALTNGVDVIADGTTLANWKQNYELIIHMFDAGSAGAVFGKTTQVLSGRWTFSKALSNGGLYLPTGSSFTLRVNDNLQGLDIFHGHVQGYLET